MVGTLAPPQAEPTPPPRRHRGRKIAVAAIAMLAGAAIVLAVLIARDLSQGGRPVPRFESLAAHPDPSLQGTVAYFVDQSRCVRIVAAAGQPSKDVLCLPQQDMTQAPKLGKEDGPQLVWLPDGRLEVTMFRMSLGKGGDLNPGWQKIVDVRTGQVEEVAAASVPSTPNLATRPMVSPTGQRITTKSDQSNGRIKVMVSDSSGTRTLLSAQGPGMYSYGLYAAFWAPNWQWIAADDGRILVVTAGDHPVTRVLVDSMGGLDLRLARFAVTADNMFSPSK